MTLPNEVLVYTQRPLPVYAIPINWESRFEILDFAKDFVQFMEVIAVGFHQHALMEGREPARWFLVVNSKDGKKIGEKGDVLVSQVDASDIFPCNRNVFLATYETPRQLSFELDA